MLQWKDIAIPVWFLLFYKQSCCWYLIIVVHYSLSFTEPSIPSNTLSLLMSLWMTWFACKKSKACKHCRYKDKREEERGGWEDRFCSALCIKLDLDGNCSTVYDRLLKSGVHLSADSSYLGFVHTSLSDDIRQRATSQVLHHHKQLIPHQEAEKQKYHYNSYSYKLSELPGSKLNFKLTCLKSWQCWGSSTPSSLESHLWWAPF